MLFNSSCFVHLYCLNRLVIVSPSLGRTYYLVLNINTLLQRRYDLKFVSH